MFLCTTQNYPSSAALAQPQLLMKLPPLTALPCRELPILLSSRIRGVTPETKQLKCSSPGGKCCWAQEQDSCTFTQGEYFWESHISTNLSNPYSWKRLSSFKKGLVYILMSAMTVSNMFPFPFTKEFWGLCHFFSLLCSQHYEIPLTPARSSLLSPSLFVFELRGEKDNQEGSQKDQTEPNIPSVLISMA